jgi:serine/threonine-protein kinase
MDGVSSAAIPSFGTLIADRYRVGRVLGEGGFGIVLSVRDETDDKDLALKLLQAVSEESAERFWREARLVSQLESDHVVRVLDTGVYDSRPFLVMERLRGETYSELTRTHPLPLPRVADCIVQTCEALAHAHAAGIVHRDIKASNLFECKSEDGVRRVKVLDFGVSKVIPSANTLERSITKTAHAGVLGSPPYMSPEHIRDARDVDGRADIWSLGVVAYVLLSARYPFDGASVPELFVEILEREHKRLRDRSVDVPDDIDEIVARCLAKRRDDRFANVGELAAAVAPFASPVWRPYGQRVVDLVARSPAQMAAERPRTSRRAGRPEPITRSVPPPEAMRTESEPEPILDAAELAALENAPTVAQATTTTDMTDEPVTEAIATEVLPPPPLLELPPVPRIVTGRSLVPTTARRSHARASKERARSFLPWTLALLALAAVALKVSLRSEEPAPPEPALVTEPAPVPTTPAQAPTVSVVIPVPMAVVSTSVLMAPPVEPSPVAPMRGPRVRHSPRPHAPASSGEAPAAPSGQELLPNPYKKP